MPANTSDGYRAEIRRDCLTFGNEICYFKNVVSYRMENVDENCNQSSCSMRLVWDEICNGKRVIKKKTINFPSLQDAHLCTEKIDKTLSTKVSPHLLSKRRNNKVCVLINPYSGQKLALKGWEESVRPVLDEAGIKYDVILTERIGHGTDIVRELDIDQYDALLVNSGDGLVSEVLCGLLCRRDRERSLKLPVCHIPGGTSNGLAAAVCYACNEPFSPRGSFFLECALMTVHPKFLPLRLFRVDTEKDGAVSMFMSAVWGLIADIDIGSERFRWAGMIRLHMEAIIRILQLPSTAKYRGRISYLPLGDKEVSRKTMVQYDMDRKLFGTGHFVYGDIPTASSSDQIEKEHFTNIAHALENQSLLKIPALDEPLDEQWKVIEGDWVTVQLTSLSHLGSDLPYLPCTKLDEPFMYLMLIDWKVLRDRVQVAQLFVTMDGSRHLPYKCVQIIPVRACRVEPLDNCGGYFAVDGEPYTNGTKFQVVPTKHCATLVGRQN